MSSLIWVVHCACVFFMTGLIWLVQLVHYPLMSRVDPSRFVEFHAAHSARITWIVGPVMLLELATAGLQLLDRPNGVEPWVLWTCAALSASVFVATGLLSVPAHSQLAQGFNEEAHRWLVQTNWVRTLAWTAHSAVAASALLEQLKTIRG